MAFVVEAIRFRRSKTLWHHQASRSMNSFFCTEAYLDADTPQRLFTILEVSGFVPERSFFGHFNALVSVGIEIAETVGRLSTQRSKSDQKSCFAFQSTLTCRPNEFSSGFQVVIHRFTQAQARRLSCQSWYMQTNASAFFVGNAFLWRRQFYGGLKRSLITGEMEEQVQLCRGDRRCDHMAILMVWPCALLPKRVTWISKRKVLWDGLDLDRSLDCSDKAPDFSETAGSTPNDSINKKKWSQDSLVRQSSNQLSIPPELSRLRSCPSYTMLDGSIIFSSQFEIRISTS